MKTNHLGVLQWNYLFYPPGKNYTFCTSIAWAGDSSIPPLLGVVQSPRPLVFVGYTYIISYYFIGGVPYLSLDRKCFISQMLDNGTPASLTSFLLKYLLVSEHTCLQAKYHTGENLVYILGQAYTSNDDNYGPFILKYSTVTKTIVSGSKVKNR